MRLIDADALIEKMKDCGFSTAQELMANAFCFAALKSESLAPTIGGWISVKDRLPEEGVRVLAVKKLKDGRRDLALATCIPEYKHHDYVTGEDVVEPYWVCGGNNNITHWMPLPEMPEEGEAHD